MARVGHELVSHDFHPRSSCVVLDSCDDRITDWKHVFSKALVSDMDPRLAVG